MSGVVVVVDSNPVQVVEVAEIVGGGGSGGGGGGLDQATADLRYVNTLGDTMTGPLVAPTVRSSTPPSTADDLTRKDYVDARTPKIVASLTQPTDTSAIWVDLNT